MSPAPSAPTERAEPGASCRPARPPATPEHVLLRDGSSVVLRPLVTGDEGAIATWFAGLGPETRYARFLAVVKRLDARTCSELARVDHRNREAITAVAPDGTTVGIARYVRVPEPATAEVAVAVVDRWRGRGIASLLLERITARARADEIDWFIATCLASNVAIIRLLTRLGPTEVSEPDCGVVELRIALEDPARDRRRAEAASAPRGGQRSPAA
jgi:acetyltransferase